MNAHPSDGPAGLSRRQFVGGAAGALALAAAGRALAAEQPAAPERKIKLGVVGNGGRGAWIANLFKQHGGYEMWAVADYFQAAADRCGNALGVDKARRFSGLSGYKRVLDSGVEAIALETPPCFFPTHATAAVDAGVHVYVAKPVAIDVPGCLAIEAAGKKATEKKLCFLVDYQIPTDPKNIEVCRQVQAGKIGTVMLVDSHYYAGPWNDPPLTGTIESRIHGLIWCNDLGIGGSHHVNASIHTVDGVLWVIGKRPVAAQGASRIARPNAHGDSPDVFSITYEFEDGPVWSHHCKHFNDRYGGVDFCQAILRGQGGYAEVHYNGKATLLNADTAYKEDVVSLYDSGAKRNIAAFYENITGGKFDNPSVRRAVDGTLTAIMGREAAARRTRLTMEELLKEKPRIETDLHGLKE